MTGVLILTTAAVIYALVCLARPHHACPRCHGERMAKNSKGRRVRCRSCRGTGIKARPGARLVHGFYQHVKGEPDRAGRTGRINRAQAQAEHERAEYARELASELLNREAQAGKPAEKEEVT